MLYSFIGYSVFEHYLLCSQATKAYLRVKVLNVQENSKETVQKAVPLLRSLKVMNLKDTKEEAV